MTRFKVLIIGVLAGVLTLGSVVPAMADAGAENSTESASPLSGSEMEALVDELEDINEFELVPMPHLGRMVKFDGGFKGVWGVEDSTTPEPPGMVAGVYGRGQEPDGTRYGFFGGIWKNHDGTLTGYLTGRYGNGYFWGVWRCVETGSGGPVGGTYAPTANAINDVLHHFAGEWRTKDGQLTGYLTGTWARMVQFQRQGRFAGQWAYDPNVAAAESLADGMLSGNYAVIKLADGNSFYYLKGRWNSNDGARGVLAGLVVDGRFFGLWNSSNNTAHGYLKGAWADHTFKGSWGHFGHPVEGRLWGRYGPFPTVEAVPQAIEKQPLATQKPAVALLK